MNTNTQNNSKILINQKDEFKTNLDLSSLHYRGENFITSLLHPNFPRNDKRSNKVLKVYMDKWEVKLLTFLYDFKQKQAEPGTYLVYPIMDFYTEFIHQVVMDSKMLKLFKEYSLFDTKSLYFALRRILYFFDSWDIIDACSGISINQNAIVSYRDLVSDPEKRKLPKFHIPAESRELPEIYYPNDNYYEEYDDVRFTFFGDIDKAITYCFKNTTENVTILSEEDFYKKFKEYVETEVREDERSEYNYISSIQNFYEYILYQRPIINFHTQLYWSFGSGYVIWVNDELFDASKQMN